MSVTKRYTITFINKKLIEICTSRRPTMDGRYLRKNQLLALCFYFKQYGDTLEKQMCSLCIYTAEKKQ